MEFDRSSWSAGGRRVAVIGLGYVGLPTALALADAGCRVMGCDVSEERLAAVKAGRADLLEADRARLTHHLGSAEFILTTNVAMAADADAVVVCVPTPVDRHQVPDMAALTVACQNVVQCAHPGQMIILTSTTYVGCTRDLLIEPLVGKGFTPGTDVFIGFCPERIDPGNAVHAQGIVPRIVGGATPECARQCAEFVALSTSSVHSVSSAEAAEATKLLENAFRAVNIAFTNEFADACGEFGIDVLEVIEAAATKPYGFMPFYPGPGVGGHCIPCDPHYLLWQLRARHTRLPVTESAMSAVALRPHQVVSRAVEVLAGRAKLLAGSRVLVAGVTYKPGVADLRGSPPLDIIDELLDRGAEVGFTDPRIEVLRIGRHRLEAVPDPAPGDWDLSSCTPWTRSPTIPGSPDATWCWTRAVSVYQPNFMAWLRLLDKILASDVFVAYDTVQYTRSEYHSRQKVKYESGATWLSVPLRTGAHTLLRDTRIDNAQPFRGRQLKRIRVSYEAQPVLRRGVSDRRAGIPGDAGVPGRPEPGADHRNLCVPGQPGADRARERAPARGRQRRADRGAGPRCLRYGAPDQHVRHRPRLRRLGRPGPRRDRDPLAGVHPSRVRATLRGEFVPHLAAIDMLFARGRATATELAAQRSFVDVTPATMGR